MRFWLPVMFEPIDQFCEIARHAEECGFAGLALADHLVVPEGFASVHPSGENPMVASSPFPDPFTMIAAMSSVTTTLEFMSYVYLVGLRDPFTVAKQVATTAEVSGHRTTLGVGAGWLLEEFGAVGHEVSSRGRRLDDSISIIRDFWEDGYAEHHGEFFDFPRSAMFPVPRQPIPIWVGGRSEAALRRAAANDGWLGMDYPIEECERLLDRLAELRRDAGDTRDDFGLFVIPRAEPSTALFDRLGERGVGDTIGMAWPLQDPAFADIDAKKSAMDRFATAFTS